MAGPNNCSSGKGEGPQYQSSLEATSVSREDSRNGLGSLVTLAPTQWSGALMVVIGPTADGGQQEYLS